MPPWIVLFYGVNAMCPGHNDNYPPHTTSKATVEVSFIGRPGDANDILCQRIAESMGGVVTGGGTFLGTSERDLTIDLPVAQVAAFIRALGTYDTTFRAVVQGGTPDRPAA